MSNSSVFKSNNTWLQRTTMEKITERHDTKNRILEEVYNCKRHKTLCMALNELAKFEENEGTDVFCDNVIKFNADLTNIMSLNHHYVTGGGNPKDNNIESTEFITFGFPRIERGIWYHYEIEPPEFPLYVDIEYVEMAYALTRMKLPIAHSAYYSWNSLKQVAQLWPGVGGTNFGHIPNKYGFILGNYIANNYDSIRAFANDWCMGTSCRL